MCLFVSWRSNTHYVFLQNTEKSIGTHFLCISGIGWQCNLNYDLGRGLTCLDSKWRKIGQESFPFYSFIFVKIKVWQRVLAVWCVLLVRLAQCRHFRNFLTLRFYVKSISRILELQKLQLTAVLAHLEFSEFWFLCSV